MTDHDLRNEAPGTTEPVLLPCWVDRLHHGAVLDFHEAQSALELIGGHCIEALDDNPGCWIVTLPEADQADVLEQNGWRGSVVDESTLDTYVFWVDAL